MTVSILTFSISSIGIIGLIAMKHFEMRKRATILSAISRRYDRTLWKVWRLVMFMTLGLAHKSHIRIRFWIRVVLKRMVRNAYIAIVRRLSAHGKKIIDIERRERRLLKKRGAVSFFLKDIVHHKRALHK